MKGFLTVGLALSLLFGVSRSLAEELTVADGMQVSFEYTLTLSDKTQVASNVGQEPVTYVHGQKQIVPGLEKALVGLKAGQSKHVEVSSAEGYGAYDEKAHVTVDKSQVPADIKAGTMLMEEGGRPVKVLEVNGDKVVLDMNHPLAGKDLVFDVKIVKVEKATVSSAPLEAPAAHD